MSYPSQVSKYLLICILSIYQLQASEENELGIFFNACSRGNMEKIREMIVIHEKYDLVDQKYSSMDKYPIEIAAEKGNSEIVEFLLNEYKKKGAVVDLERLFTSSKVSGNRELIKKILTLKVNEAKLTQDLKNAQLTLACTRDIDVNHVVPSECMVGHTASNSVIGEEIDEEYIMV